MRKTTVSVAKADRKPAGEKVCTGRDLARALRRVKLSAEEAKAWSRI
jgi:hypothetical protein